MMWAGEAGRSGAVLRFPKKPTARKGGGLPGQARLGLPGHMATVSAFTARRGRGPAEGDLGDSTRFRVMWDGKREDVVPLDTAVMVALGVMVVF